MAIYWPYYFKKEQMFNVLFEHSLEDVVMKRGRVLADDGKCFLIMELEHEGEGTAYWTVPKRLCMKR